MSGARDYSKGISSFMMRKMLTGYRPQRPILFSDPMVRAILAGVKTMTRRLVKPQPPADLKWGGWVVESSDPKTVGCATWHDTIPLATRSHYVRPRYGAPGTLLWVKEAYDRSPFDEIFYRADGVPQGLEGKVGRPWLSPIYMPRWASRILLELTGVRAERLQDITEEDAKREGVSAVEYKGIGECRVHWDMQNTTEPSYRGAFRDLWDSLYDGEPGKQWDANPWVFVLSFRRIE